MIKIIVIAPKGKMSSLVLEEAIKSEKIDVVAAIGPKGRQYIGTEIFGVRVYDDLELVIDQCDLVVDFSRAEVAMKVLDTCLAHNTALFEGTTGFTKEESEKIDVASKQIPLLKAANTSFMVNVLMELLEYTSQRLANDCDIEILDIHDRDKVDEPSGTAIEMGETIAHAGNIKGEMIRFHSGRIGDSPSTHIICFGGSDERIEFHHQSYTGRCFAIGACRAIEFMEDKKKGLYRMADVVKQEAQSRT